MTTNKTNKQSPWVKLIPWVFFLFSAFLIIFAFTIFNRPRQHQMHPTTAAVRRLRTANELVVIRHSTDVLMDVKIGPSEYYTVIVPFVADVGYDLTEIRTLDHSDGSKEIELPLPRILRSAWARTDGSPRLLIRESDSANMDDLVRSFEEFGESFVSQLASDPDVMEEARRVVLAMMETLFGPGIKFSVAEADGGAPTGLWDSVEFRSANVPFFWRVPREINERWDFMADSDPASYNSTILSARHVSITMDDVKLKRWIDDGTSAGSLNELARERGWSRAFHPDYPKEAVYLDLNRSGRQATAYTNHQGVMYSLSATFPSIDTFDNRIEDFLILAYGLRAEGSWTRRRDTVFSVTSEIWSRSNTPDQRHHFTRMIEASRISDNKIKNIEGIAFLTDQSIDERDDEREVREFLNSIRARSEVVGEHRMEPLLIIRFESGWFLSRYSNAFVVLGRDRMDVLVDPPARLLGIRRTPEWVSVPYADLNLANASNNLFWNEGDDTLSLTGAESGQTYQLNPNSSGARFLTSRVFNGFLVALNSSSS